MPCTYVHLCIYVRFGLTYEIAAAAVEILIIVVHRWFVWTALSFVSLLLLLGKILQRVPISKVGVVFNWIIANVTDLSLSAYFYGWICVIAIAYHCV